MNKLMQVGFLGAIAMLAMCAGCVTAPVPGATPAAVPPRLVMNADFLMTWNDAGAFGPVPNSLQAAGDAYCRRFVEGHAVGYHPMAQDETGKRFKDGGYLCFGAARDSLRGTENGSLR